MSRRKHWSEKLWCPSCGMTFRSTNAEAVHRHHFPTMCRSIKRVNRVRGRQPNDGASNVAGREGEQAGSVSDDTTGLQRECSN